MPPYPNGSLQQQLTQQYSYLFQMAQQLNMALTALEGETAKVDLAGGTAVVTGPASDEALTKAVTDAGYEVVDIK